MFGLRVLSKKNKFKELFEPIFSDLKGYKWLFGCDSFFLPMFMAEKSDYDYEKEKYVSGAGVEFENDMTALHDSEDWCFSKTDILSKYGEGVNEDWNGIFGFQKMLIQPHDWVKKYSEVKNQSEFVNRTVDICFLNVDAAYWEIHCKNQQWIAIIKEHLRSLPKVESYACDISKSYGL
ncbi:hypothetical protein BGP_5361 [Beggiatoa sp. PS]|nr:hypothetical protein BGP_5361 [Beggiatoa sp. PS]